MLISADYSQIELRVLAHLAGEEALIEAFRTGEDIHDRTALKVFGADSGLDQHELRRRAKIINYALLYGKTAFTLAKDIGVTQGGGAGVHRRLLRRLPAGARLHRRDARRRARETGVVKTLFGRRRLVPELNSRNGQIRAAAERETVNMPIQGTAADILKKRHDRPARASCRGAGLRTRMILTVHDELLFEAPRDEADAAAALVRERMEGAVELTVPLTVDVGIAENWRDAKSGQLGFRFGPGPVPAHWTRRRTLGIHQSSTNDMRQRLTQYVRHASIACLRVAASTPRPAGAPRRRRRTSSCGRADATVIVGAWSIVADTTAAGGSRLGTADAGAAKLTAALASPANYFELTFAAEAATPYRLWLRGKAQGNSYDNDSVYVQFSDSVTSGGAATWRIGSTAGATVTLEDCTSCGVSGWGWQDNGFGAGVLGTACLLRRIGHAHGAHPGSRRRPVDRSGRALAGDIFQQRSRRSSRTTTRSWSAAARLRRRSRWFAARTCSRCRTAPRLSCGPRAKPAPPAATRRRAHRSRRRRRSSRRRATGLAFDYYQHEATVTGLTPATIYAYDVSSSASAAQRAGTDQFTTAPRSGPDA